MREYSIRDAAVFVLLVAVGAAGRLWQPDWCVTPIAATGLLAGWWFGRPLAAVFVPLLAMLISDVALDAYHSFPVMLTVYCSLASSAVLGGWLRHGAGAAWLARLGACSLAPATLFFLTSNLAVFLTQSMYEKSLAGLAQCYSAALPFYGRMLVGDVAFTALLFGAAAVSLGGLGARRVAA